MLMVMSVILPVYCESVLRNLRLVWMVLCSLTWWENVVLNTFSQHDWMQNFRTSGNTFYYLCTQLKPLLEKQTTRLRTPVSVERHVAITLWVLATTAEYHTIATLFGVVRCTLCLIIHETCIAIVTKLLSVYISFPLGDVLKEVVEGLKEKWDFPQCAGSIDGSLISISLPLMNHTDYYNRKGFYSVIVQAVVDHNCLFRNICVGWPGSVHDAMPILCYIVK